MERVTQLLQPGGELYLTFGTTALRRHIRETFSELERSVAESSMPILDVGQSGLLLCRIFSRLSGLQDIAALGASSIRDEALGFSNRTVLAAEANSSGWLWKMHGESEPRLARIGELPECTAFAIDFGINFRPAADALRSAGLEDWLDEEHHRLLNMSPDSLMETLSGNWQMVIMIPDGKKFDRNANPLEELLNCDMFISAPDNREMLKNLISLATATLPSTKKIGNVIYVSNGNGEKTVIALLPKRVLLFSSARCFDDLCDGSANIAANGKFVPDGHFFRKRQAGDSLASDPAFAAARKRLPENSHGVYYSSNAKIGRLLKLGGQQGVHISLPHGISRAIGSWQIDSGTIVNRELATAELSVQVFDTLIFSPLLIAVDRALRYLETPKLDHPAVDRQKKPPAVKPDAAVKSENSSSDRHQAEKCAECRAHLKKLQSFISEYAKTHHGEFPASLPEKIGCGASGYMYFAPFSAKPSGKMPLVADLQKETHIRG